MSSRLDGLRVLVVEDDEPVAMILSELLEALGCVVVGTASRLAAAVEAVGMYSFDLAMLDVNLYGEGVFPVAQILADRDLPFVFLTGYGDSGIPPKFGKRPILGKPYRMRDLANLVETALPA